MSNPLMEDMKRAKVLAKRVIITQKNVCPFSHCREANCRLAAERRVKDRFIRNLGDTIGFRLKSFLKFMIDL